MSRRDPLHERAARLFADLLTGRHGGLLLPDVVFVETMNYLRAKVRDRRLAEDLGDLYFGRAAGPMILYGIASPREVLEAAQVLHLEHYDRGLSMTDCVVIAHAENVNAKVATFDTGFERLVPLVDG